MSFKICRCGGTVLLTPTMEKIIFLSSLIAVKFKAAKLVKRDE